jgi:hypothetical protein
MGDLWPKLLRFIDDPRLALDNEATGRAMRGRGRKNNYCSSSERGTDSDISRAQSSCTSDDVNGGLT